MARKFIFPLRKGRLALVTQKTAAKAYFQAMFFELLIDALKPRRSNREYSIGYSNCSR